MRNGVFRGVWPGNCPIIAHVLIFALDTSSPSGSLAVLRDDKLIGTVSTCTGEIHSSRVFRQLDFLLRELSLKLDEFDLFAVTVGPGSFTGLRVGLAAVKGWSEVYRKPIAAVSSLEAVAAQARSPASMLVPVLDARRGQLYFATYQRSAAEPDELSLEGDERVGTAAEMWETIEAARGNRECVIVTPVPELLSKKSSLSETNRGGAAAIRMEPASDVLAPYVARVGRRRAEQGRLADSLTLDANYVRRSDAELHWKAPAGS